MAKTNIEKLMELKHLYEQGILTKEEMEIEKQKILVSSYSNDTNSERVESIDNNILSNEQFEATDIDVIKDNNELTDEDTPKISEEVNASFFQKHKKIVTLATLTTAIAVICIIFFSINRNSEMTQTKIKEADNKDEILNQPKESMVYDNNEKMVKFMDDFFKEQKKKGDLSLERFLRNDDIKNLIVDKYNPNYYNAVMDLLKQNGFIGDVEVASNGTYKGHANVCERTTGVDPYDDWAVDFSYNPSHNQLELKATVFKIPLNDDGSVNNEGIEKELERLTAENREKEQKEIKEIESQAINIETVIDAYKNNVDGRADNIYYKQEKIYKFYLKKIRKSSSDYEYVMEGSGSSHGDSADILVYTDDSRLTYLDFPVTICFRGTLTSIGRPEYGSWYIYHFVCTEALTYSN